MERWTVARRSLAGDLVSFSECLLRPATRNSALSTVDGLMARLIDEQALLEDLLVHIQHVTIGAILGETAPRRQTQDPTLARIVMQSNGQLAIVEGAQG